MYPSSPWLRTLRIVTLAIALLLLACDAPAGLLGITTGRSTDRRASYSLSISPGNHTVYVGDTVLYRVTVTDRAGQPVPPASTAWRISDATLAQIDSDGVLLAQRAGNATVTVVTYSQEHSVPLSLLARLPEPVPDPAPARPPPGSTEPTFMPGVHQSLWADDFEASSSTAAVYARYATRSGEDGLHLDATGGVGGSKGLRIEWQPRAGCTDDSHFIEGSFPAAQEVVVQYSVRYQAGFVFDWIGRGGPCSGNAKKLFFLWAASGSRFDFISENHFLGVGSDVDHPLFAQHAGATVTPEMLGDGRWHRITLRVRQSSTPTATDGFIHGWIDGVLRWAVNDIASHASGGWVLFKLPTTFNQGSPVPQVEWLDDFRIWRP